MARKLTKSDNPFKVKRGQVWRRDEEARKNRSFAVSRVFVDSDSDVAYAEVSYPAAGKIKASTQFIKLSRFNRYKKLLIRAAL
jgi:hypothetical protein